MKTLSDNTLSYLQSCLERQKYKDRLWEGTSSKDHYVNPDNRANAYHLAYHLSSSAKSETAFYEIYTHLIEVLEAKNRTEEDVKNLSEYVAALSEYNLDYIQRKLMKELPIP